MRRRRCIARARSTKPRLAMRACCMATPSTQRRSTTWRRSAVSRAALPRASSWCGGRWRSSRSAHAPMCCWGGRWSSSATSQEALASFDRAIACEGTHADAHGNRGDVLAQLGRLQEAIESYRRAIAIEPGSLANWCNLGAAQAELGRHDEALASYQQVIALQPSLIDAHLMRGNLLRALGRNAEALASYDRALAVAPNEVSALIGRAAALVALKRPDDALASLDRRSAIDPSDAGRAEQPRFPVAVAQPPRRGAGEPRPRARDRSEPCRSAVQSRRAAVRARPATARRSRATTARWRFRRRHVQAHCNRSKTLFALNRYRRGARRRRAGAGARSRRMSKSLYTRGMVLGRLHRYDEAIAAFERVLELAPAAPARLAQLATSCLAICAWDKAAAAAGRSDRGACGRNRDRRTAYPVAIVGQPGRDASRHPPLCRARDPARPAAGRRAPSAAAATRSGWPICRGISGCTRSPI